MAISAPKERWREQILFLHDRSFCQRESDPPENAVVVFLAPVEVEVKTQTLLCGGIVTMGGFLQNMAGDSPRVFHLSNSKVACSVHGTYMLACTGSLIEPDETLCGVLDAMLRAFFFFHGGFERVKAAARYDRKRFSSTMTRIWTSLSAYYRPNSGGGLHAAFGTIPRPCLPLGANRLHVLATQLLQRTASQNVLGTCLLRGGSLVAESMPPGFVHYARALLQTKPLSASDEEAHRLRARGSKIRDLMRESEIPLLKTREYRGQMYKQSFVGADFIDLLLAVGEVRSRAAGQSLGRTLLQAGVIHHVLNEDDFKDEHRYYRFRVDEEAAAGSVRSGSGSGGVFRNGDGARGVNTGGQSSDMRPLVLSGHGRDARTTMASRGLVLPEGVHLINVFVPEEDIWSMQDTCWPIARTGSVRGAAGVLRHDYSADGAAVLNSSFAEMLSLGNGEAPNGDRGGDSATSTVLEELEPRTEGGGSGVDSGDTKEEEGHQGTHKRGISADKASTTSDEMQRRHEVPTSSSTFVSAPGTVATAQRDVLGEYMHRMSLSAYRVWLEAQGYTAASALHRALLRMTPIAMERLLRDYDGSAGPLVALKDALINAAATASAIQAEEDAEAADDTPEGMAKAGLYMQGVGDSVLVVLLEEACTLRQEFLAALAAEVDYPLREFEQAFGEAYADVPHVTPRAAEDYNHVCVSAALNSAHGWASRHWRQGDDSLVPDTETDRAFVEGVASIRELFREQRSVEGGGSSTASVSAAVLRKNYEAAVYGKAQFGREAYFQARHAGEGLAIAARNLRPFDAELARVPAQARNRLAHDRGIYDL